MVIDRTVKHAFGTRGRGKPGIMKLFPPFSLITGLCILSFGVQPACAGQRPFAITPVPQGGGEYVASYLVRQTRAPDGRIAATVQSVDVLGKKTASSVDVSTVDCREPRVVSDGREVAVNPEDAQASLATIADQNLWWLVCRHVFRKYH